MTQYKDGETLVRTSPHPPKPSYYSGAPQKSYSYRHAPLCGSMGNTSFLPRKIHLVPFPQSAIELNTKPGFFNIKATSEKKPQNSFLALDNWAERGLFI